MANNWQCNKLVSIKYLYYKPIHMLMYVEIIPNFFTIVSFDVASIMVVCLIYFIVHHSRLSNHTDTPAVIAHISCSVRPEELYTEIL